MTGGKHTPTQYWNPYLSGIGLGLVMLLSFVLSGRGLGVSGAFDDLVTSVMNASGFSALFGDWIFIEVLGLVVGAMASGYLAGRMRRTSHPKRGCCSPPAAERWLVSAPALRTAALADRPLAAALS